MWAVRALLIEQNLRRHCWATRQFWCAVGVEKSRQRIRECRSWEQTSSNRAKLLSILSAQGSWKWPAKSGCSRTQIHLQLSPTLKKEGRHQNILYALDLSRKGVDCRWGSLQLRSQLRDLQVGAGENELSLAEPRPPHRKTPAVRTAARNRHDSLSAVWNGGLACVCISRAWVNRVSTSCGGALDSRAAPEHQPVAKPTGVRYRVLRYSLSAIRSRHS